MSQTAIKVLSRISVVVLIATLFIPINSTLAQDSIPSPIEPDTAITETIIIRRPQYKIEIIPRGVNLTSPVISFKSTKPLLKTKKRFRPPSFWEKENEFGFSMSEVAFVNWNAGGDNSVSGIGSLKFVRNYKFRYIQWNNELVMRYGINAQEGREVRKTDDQVRISSQFGYRNDTITPWYYSAKGKFNTQFTDGFKYPDTDNPISRFMAPGYLFLGGGASYIPEGKKFNLYLSPASFKTTFVLDQVLANQGAFGVKRAVLDDEGNVLEEGERSFSEFVILITNTWEKEVLTNVVMTHKLSLYTDYLRSFGNVDIDWELNFEFKVNSFLQAQLGVHVIYDDDIRFDQVIADNGTVLDNGTPKIQLRQFLGLGIIYNF